MAFEIQYDYYKKLSIIVSKILDEARIFEAPVPIKQVASMCGTVVVPYELGDEVSGVLVVEGNKGTIGYNTSNLRVRQRFTIAHELGHWLQHVDREKNPQEFFVDKDFIVKFRSDKKYTDKEITQEREANAFAAAILMPQKFIMDELKKPQYHGLNENKLIEQLARVFEVSVPAMTYRLSDLNIFQY